MKQKDVALLIVIVSISAILALVVSHYVFASPKARQQTVEVVSPITAGFATPDSKYFNGQSVDPKQLIQIGTSTHPNPFNGSGQ